MAILIKDGKLVSSALEHLKMMMEKLGIEPKRSLGQNFLISDHVIEKIVKAANSFHADTLYEIGPGLGALTRHLRETNKNYHLLELDKKFAEFWRGEGLSVYEGDALQMDWSQLPRTGKAVLVSNLPYQISSSLVIEKSVEKNPLDAMILMFQKEVAQRIRAVPNTENYGMLSIVAQLTWQIEMLLEASGRDFQPPPNVASRVLIFKRREQTLVEDPGQFLKFAKACFLHRRKLMAGNLEEGANIKRVQVEQALSEMKLKPTARAQELSLKQFVDLYKKLGY